MAEQTKADLIVPREDYAAIDIQMATARKFPRVVSNALRTSTSRADTDSETQEGCCFALDHHKPRLSGRDSAPGPW